uniref:Ig-like domain-containing protein n=1 Tax=Gadus morhua TaxID=8049 RepID=A0A8C5CR36_GADMO
MLTCFLPYFYLYLYCNVKQKMLSLSLELTVRPGQNVTLYCDCKLTTNVNLVWYRNCSHENQPTLALNWKDRDNGIFEYEENGRNFSHLNMMLNASSNSYDLLIKNITDSHLGLYYCGTEELNGEKGNKKEYIYTYGKIITRILFGKILLGKYDISSVQYVDDVMSYQSVHYVDDVRLQ